MTFPDNSFAALELRLNALRKEPATLDSKVVTKNPGDAPLDYSYGSLLVDLAKKNLDEACPDRQAERLALALGVLRLGLQSLTEWAASKGVYTINLQPTFIPNYHKLEDFLKEHGASLTGGTALLQNESRLQPSLSDLQIK